MRLVLATANPDKATEMAAILAPPLPPEGRGQEAAPPIELVARPAWLGDVEETADTLEGNARLKARAVMAATGEPAVADDTGLEVEALGGAPGVRSARYAGEAASYSDNVAKLLSELSGASSRRARFRTVAAVCFPSGRELAAEGVVHGAIATHPRGGGGFGYDAVFTPDDGDGRTFAEMEAAEKHAISHRARALRALRAALDDEGPGD